MPSICVYTIALNEEKFVDRFMDSIGSADAVYVLDTGSTDKTAEKLRSRGAVVDVQTVKPWRFDVARNISIEKAPACDILFCIDLDEIIAEPDWKERIRAAWKSEHNRARYRYVWNQNPDGSDGTAFIYEKIHTKDYEWFLPCHELLRRRNDKPGEDVWCDIPITVKHFPDPAKSRGSYLPLLKLASEENPDNDRIAHYYGRELFFASHWWPAIMQLERHVKMPNSTWADERCASMSYIARAYEAISNDSEAERWHLRACAEAPHLREPFVDAARFYNARNRFPMGWALAKRALQIEHRPATYITRSDAWNEAPWDLTSTAAYYIGMKPESLACARKACELAPWDARLKDNLAIVERMSPELTKNRPVPKIIDREPWALNPKFGLVIATYGSVPYIHTALAVRQKLYPDVRAFVVDDCSPEADKLRKLCDEYGADFTCNPERLNHTRGDTTAFALGLRWASLHGLDVLVKTSRRFIPKEDWRPSLREVIHQTQHATYSGGLDATWGLRTECIAMYVAKWLPHADTLESQAKHAQWLWVEKLIHDHAIEIMPWGTGGFDGAALWEFPGLGKYIKTPSHLWHDTADPKEYAYFAQSLGLNYSTDDFK